MEGEMKKLTYAWLCVVGSLSYSYIVSSRVGAGKWRLLSLLPVFYVFTILPYSLSSAFNTAVLTFFITWLANFKLLLFSFNRGPLMIISNSNSRSLLYFISIASLPIRTINSNTPPKKKKKFLLNLNLNLAAELLGFAIVVRFLHIYKERLHHNILLGLYCCLCFLLIDVLVALSSAVVRALVGLDLEPPSHQPYLSTSLQEFWGRRWNLTVTSSLRGTVYEPVRTASTKLAGKEWARVVGVLAAFLVSGLMHELLFYNVTRVKPTWEMTSFFVVQGICVVAEVGVKSSSWWKWKLPSIVSAGLTVGFVVATSFWLFFPPLIRNGADATVLEEMRSFLEFLTTNASLLF